MAFSLFKKSTAPPQDPVDRLLGIHERSRATAFEVMPEVLGKRKWEFVARNASIACEDSLARMAVFLRAKANIAQAQAELAACSPALDGLERALQAVTQGAAANANWIYVANLKHPLLACFLAGDWQRAQRVAEASHFPQLVNADASADMSHFDAFVRMLIATLERKPEEFARCRQAYASSKERKESHFFSSYFVYDTLMAYILERNQEALNAELVRLEKLYSLRANDLRTTHDRVVLDAMLDMNAISFDVWSTALACLAQREGLNVDISTDVIPVAVFGNGTH